MDKQQIAIYDECVEQINHLVEQYMIGNLTQEKFRGFLRYLAKDIGQTSLAGTKEGHQLVSAIYRATRDAE
jgi:hypothetical protein